MVAVVKAYSHQTVIGIRGTDNGFQLYYISGGGFLDQYMLARPDSRFADECELIVRCCYNYDIHIIAFDSYSPL
jgi:hypothetical protein